VHDDLRRAVDAIPGLMWSALPDGTVDFFNLGWREYTGMGLEAAAGSGWQEAIHTDDRPGVIERWHAVLATRQSGEFEGRLRRSDGAYRWFLIRAVPLRGEAGAVVGWYAQSIDIHDRKRAEALLAGEKQLLEMITRGSPLTAVLARLCRIVESATPECHCAVLLVDPTGTKLHHAAAPSLPASYTAAIDGRDVDADEGPCGMAACRKQQVIAADVASDPRWDARGWRLLALSHGFHACWSTPIVGPDGRALGTFALYWREPRGPSEDDQRLIGQITHLAALAIERGQTAAERKRAGDDLRRSERFLAEAQRLSATGSFSWRVADDAIAWSEETYRIYGIDPALPVTFDLVGARLHPDETLWFQDLLGRARVEGRDLDFEHRLLMPDGSIKFLHVVARASRGEDGGLEFIGAVQDVTERRRSEDTLNQVRAELAHVARVTALGALTASIAHEVNQPLAGIMTNAGTSLRLLADDPPNLEGARETARRTIRDARRAADVIARLRALVRKAAPACEPVDLNEATLEVLALLATELRKAAVVLQTELADGLPAIAGDRVQLQQVVLNLVMNAVEAMSGVADRPRLLVVATERRPDGHVQLSVRDSGPGFARQDADRLFDAFYTTKPAGMGIGLSISRSIVEGHGGSLRASCGDGAGATFELAVPVAAGGDRADPPSRISFGASYADRRARSEGM
jgi:PAS domain S-box-containing protein